MNGIASVRRFALTLVPVENVADDTAWATCLIQALDQVAAETPGGRLAAPGASPA